MPEPGFRCESPYCYRAYPASCPSTPAGWCAPPLRRPSGAVSGPLTRAQGTSFDHRRGPMALHGGLCGARPLRALDYTARPHGPRPRAVVHLPAQPNQPRALANFPKHAPRPIQQPGAAPGPGPSALRPRPRTRRAGEFFPLERPRRHIIVGLAEGASGGGPNRSWRFARVIPTHILRVDVRSPPGGPSNWLQEQPNSFVSPPALGQTTSRRKPSTPHRPCHTRDRLDRDKWPAGPSLGLT